MVLIEAWNNLRESSDFKFYELRKIKICDPLTNQSLQNIAISNNIIFIATHDALKVIVVPLVLEFEWSSKIQNQILDSYNSVLIPLSIKPTYLSTCGGKSGILVVSGLLNSNLNQTQIQFFDLTDLNAVNSDLKPFSTIDLVTANDDIVDLDWHPDYNESLFITVLASGALISVGVNLSQKHSQILGILPKKDCLQKEKIKCASWSPKGKQFVIGTESGQIIQIKHTNGTDFSIARKIEPDLELKGYEINAIKWCFSPLFMVAYVKFNNERDLDVRHITVYAPPAQKNKTAILPVFNNHAQLCIERFRPGIRYKTSFVHLGSVILCSTSFSSEIGVLVCDDVESNLNCWIQLMLADENRLDLPIISNNQSLSKGLSLYLSDTKLFRINETQTIGGRNCPLLMIISSEGILNNYYVCYPKLICPTQFETKQLEFRHIPPILPIEINQQISNSQQLQIKQTTPNQQQNTQIHNQSAQTNVQIAQLQQSQLSNQQIQQQKALDQVQQEKLRALQIQQQAKEAEIQKEKERKQQMEENHAYLIAIEEEITQFSRLVLESKERYKKTNSKEIGKEPEKRVLIDLSNGLESDLNDIRQKLNNIDIELLENFLLENLAMTEEARSRIERDNDSKLSFLFKKRPLDPVTTRKIKEIDRKTIYIETNLKEINYILDQQWQDYIVSEKERKLSTVSPLNLVYQTRLILHSLERQLRSLEPFLPWKDINYKLNYKKRNIKKLTKSVGKLKISEEKNLNENEDSIDDQDSDKIEIFRFTKKNRENLLRILDSRCEIPIKRSSLPVDINSAIMISAVSKAKEKIKLSKKHTEQNQAKYLQASQKVILPITSNKKIVEQQQQQRQKLSENKPTTQVKTTGTFVPPVLSQQPILLNSQSQQSQQITTTSSAIKSNDIPLQSQQPPSKSEPFKFPFNQVNSNQSIQFNATEQSKQTVQIQQSIEPKQTIKTTQVVPLNSSTVVSSLNQKQQSQGELFTCKSGQLNLTFDKSNLNLLSSTPIKNQQKMDSNNKTVTLFSNPVLNQSPNIQVDSMITAIDSEKQHMTQLVTNVDNNNSQVQLNKHENQLKTVMTNPIKYEDISPASTPLVDNIKQPESMEKLPQFNSFEQPSQPSTQQDQSVFSFNQSPLATLSKLTIPTTFPITTSSQFSFPNALGKNIQNIQKTSVTDASIVKTNLLSSTKPLFNQIPTTTTNTSTNSANQKMTPSTIASTSLFGSNQPAITSLAQGSIFKTNPIVFNPMSTLNSLQQLSNPTTTLSSSTTTTISSIFGINTEPTATSEVMNLSITKNNAFPINESIITQANMIQIQPQQSILIPNQTSNMQSPSFTSTTIQQQQPTSTVNTILSKPFLSLTSLSNTTTQSQTTFGFSSMSSLGHKPNPENVNKNPFGCKATTAQNTSPTNLFGNTSNQQQGLFGSSFSSQLSNQPISTSSFSSSFGHTNTGTSAFGSAYPFSTAPMSTTNIFGATNTSPVLNKATFAFQTQQPQQSTKFGAKPTFGATPIFGVTSNSTFGSSQPQKTGFDSFANANVPTFGSFGNTGTSPSFETIAHNQPSHQHQGFSAFVSTQPNTLFGLPNTQFGGSQFSERRA